MQKNKLIQVIKTLSAEEMRWLSKFVVSPYYNSNQYVVRLFEYLKKLYPAFSEKKLKEELVFAEIFEDEEFDIKRLRVISSRLFAVVEQFLVVENGKEKPLEFQQKLTEEYGKRNLYKYFEKGIHKMANDLQKQPYRDADYFKNRMLLNRWYYEHPTTNRQEPIAQKALTDCMDCLDAYLILSKLELSLGMQSLISVSQKEYSIRLLEEIKEEGARSFSDIPVVTLYLNNLILLQKEDDAFFEKSKAILLNRASELNEIDRRSIFLLLMNYCAKRIRTGKTEFMQTKFDLRRSALEDGCLIQNNKLSINTFWNLTVEGVRLGEVVWIETFLEDYHKYLNETTKEETVSICRALVAFHKKTYQNVIELLYSLNSGVLFFKITQRSLLIRTYFMLFIENDDYENLLFSQLDAFEKFIRRETIISDVEKRRHLNFISLTKKMAAASHSAASLSKLREGIASSGNLDIRQWFDKTIDELLSKLNPPPFLQ